jgi:hypothetical protein
LAQKSPACADILAFEFPAIAAIIIDEMFWKSPGERLISFSGALTPDLQPRNISQVALRHQLVVGASRLHDDDDGI